MKGGRRLAAATVVLLTCAVLLTVQLFLESVAPDVRWDLPSDYYDGDAPLPAPSSVELAPEANTSVVALLTCYKNGRAGGVNRYFSTALQACVPFPTVYGDRANGPEPYRPPPEPTIVLMMDTLSQETPIHPRFELQEHPALAAVDPLPWVASSAASLRVKQSPSFHSRWMLDEWRLWPGEIAEGYVGPGVGTPSGTISPRLPSLSQYVTRGAHDPEAPAMLYKLENFCVDEEEGTFIAFERYNSRTGRVLTGRNMSAFEGLIETIYPRDNNISTYLTQVRFFSESNVLSVPLRKARGSATTWRDTIALSLNGYFGAESGRLPTATTPRGVDVTFVEDNALVYLVDSKLSANPAHHSPRIVSAAAQMEALDIKSILFLVLQYGHARTPRASLVYSSPIHNRWWSRGEAVSDVVKRIVPQSAHRIPQNVSQLWSIPRYLRTGAEERALQRYWSGAGIQEEAFLRTPTLGSFDALLQGAPATKAAHRRVASYLKPRLSANPATPNIPRELLETFVDLKEPVRWRSALIWYSFDDIVEAAASELQGEWGNRKRLVDLYPQLLSTATRECDAFRCSEESVSWVRGGHPAETLNVTQFGSYGGERGKIDGNMYSRCARPYAVIAVSGRNITSYRTWWDPRYRKAALYFPGRYSPVVQDTGNYSRHVWHNAARALSREAKRLRRDILRAQRDPAAYHEPRELIPMLAPAPLGASFAYVLDWRRRLLSFMVAASQGRRPGTPAVNISTAATAYFGELFGALLEAGHLREEQADKTKLPPRQLMCYRRAYLSSVAHRSIPHPGYGQMMSGPTTCESHPTAEVGFLNTRQRFKMCSAASDAPKARPAASEPQLPPTANEDTREGDHPLFKLPPAANKALAEAFSESAQAINSVLEGFRERVEGARAVPGGVDALLKEMTALIKRIQGEYDDQLMAYLARNRTQAGRPMRIFVPPRSISRDFALYRPSLSVLMQDSGRTAGWGRARVSDFVDFDLHEGVGWPVETIFDRQYDPAQPLNSPRAAQMNAVLGADIMFGAHGADFSQALALKRSAFMTELSVTGYDAVGTGFNSGFFGGIAFARKVGFFRMAANTIRSPPDPYVDPQLADSADPNKNVHTFLTLQQFRQAHSLTVCGWLATNAYRLSTESGAKDSFAHLVPWWCRGGAVAVRRELGILAGAARAPSPFERAARAHFSDYGFQIPNCAPLDTLVDGTTLRVMPRSIDYELLKDTQTHCARFVGKGVLEMAISRKRESTEETIRQRSVPYQRRVHTEGLQSLMEMLNPGVGSRRLLEMSTIMLGGVRGWSPVSGCGPAAMSNFTEENRACLTQMVSLVLDPALFTGRPIAKVAPLVDALRVVAPPTISIDDPEARAEVVDWIVTQFFRVFAPLLSIGHVQDMVAREFPYGATCRWTRNATKYFFRY